MRRNRAIQLKDAAPDAILPPDAPQGLISRVVTCKTGLILAKLANITHQISFSERSKQRKSGSKERAPIYARNRALLLSRKMKNG